MLGPGSLIVAACSGSAAERGISLSMVKSRWGFPTRVINLKSVPTVNSYGTAIACAAGKHFR